MHVKGRPCTLWDHLRDRSVPIRTRGHPAKEFGPMTIVMITAWLALQLPTGIALGRFLERQLVAVRIRR